MDMRLPVMTGIDAMIEIRKGVADARIITLTNILARRRFASQGLAALLHGMRTTNPEPINADLLAFIEN